jgi:hypothetical protein
MASPLRPSVRRPARRSTPDAAPSTDHPEPDAATVTRVIAGPGLVHRDPGAPNQVPGTSFPAVIRRTVTVKNIDYNPDLNRPTHATVELGSLWTGIRTGITEGLPDYKNQAQNVIEQVRAGDYEAEDVDALAVVLANAIENGYVRKGLAGIRGSRPVLENIVRKAVVASLTPTQMDKGERTAFDTLVTNVGEDRMSRGKGAPTPVPFAALPGYLPTEVEACLKEIAEERRSWSWQNFDIYDPAPQLIGNTAAERLRQGHYQGNHTNRAGWLPAVPVGPSIDAMVLAIRQEIAQAASPSLAAAVAQPNPMAAVAANRLDRVEFEKLKTHAVGSRPALGDIALATMGFGVSAYLEFHLAHDISRLMYDAVNQKVYLTAHYKWKDGYNPFFLVTGLPQV